MGRKKIQLWKGHTGVTVPNPARMSGGSSGTLVQIPAVGCWGEAFQQAMLVQGGEEEEKPSVGQAAPELLAFAILPPVQRHPFGFSGGIAERFPPGRTLRG